MKAFIALVVVAGLGLAACKGHDKKDISASHVNAADFTKIQWMDSVVNFGTVNMGEKVQVAFKCKNVGEKPLFLDNVRAGCGCTVPDYTKGAILPGKEGEVTGAFDTNKSHPGEVRKSIFVTTNTPGGMNYTLTFTGVIKEVAGVK